MKKSVLSALSACLVTALVVSVADARNVQKERPRFSKDAAPVTSTIGEGLNATNRVAAATTTYLASYTFNTGASCIAQGWVTHDLTTQDGDFVHVDNFSGLGGGDYGLLVPLAGAKSLWIGARANLADPLVCGYQSLPGYGNNWNQLFCSKCFNTLTGTVTVSYLASWDSEPGYDQTTVEYATGCGAGWTEVSTINAGAGLYDGQQGSTAESFTIAAVDHGGSARIRFNFSADGAWSDSDGLWDTDGAFIVDNLKVEDSGGIESNQTFEAEAPGAHGTVDGHWTSCNLPGYGDLAALLPGTAALQEDPCARDLSCLWTFYNNSTSFYGCGGFPGQKAVPYGNAAGQYLTNEVWSPNIAWVGAGTEGLLEFDVYRDLPLDNLVFYVWQVRSIVGGCPQGWVNDNLVNYGEDKDWLPSSNQFGGLVVPGATHIQISLGAWDMCGVWCGIFGSGACHSHSPLIDNVRVKRVDVSGPQWQVNGFQLFQDNFATDGTITGTVRMDMANDVLPAANPSILPGDSAGVVVRDPVSGIKIDPVSGDGPAVYAYVRVRPAQPAKTGAPLSGGARWPVVGTVVNGGVTWTKVRFDTSFVQNNQTPVANTYCVDLNDNLFTPGDTVEYFFEAESNSGAKSYFFGGFRQFDNFDASGAIVTTTSISTAYANPMEATCLPAEGNGGDADILYVDDGDGRSVQPFFDQAFKQLGIYNKVDRFDVRSPSSNVGNSLASRVTDVFTQIIPIYKKIIWNSEELEDGTIGDGTGNPEKSNDFGLLYTWMDNSDLGPGLYISGDGIPNDWVTASGIDAINLRSAYLSFNVVTADHKTVGLGINPKAIGVPGGAFAHVTGPDTMIVYGGCVGINRFDVLTPTGSAVSQMRFNNNVAHSATISQTTLNAEGATAKVVLEGFSFDVIRDDRAGANGGAMDRIHHLYDVITFLDNVVTNPTGSGPNAFRNTLSQNYPNPFNPSTSIEFSVRERTPVTLNVYDVGGRLVRSLVQGDRAPGEVHRVAWDGRDNAGRAVASGVYFYKLVTNSFTQTKKMVLLK